MYLTNTKIYLDTLFMKPNNSGGLQNFARRANFTNKRTYLTWGNAFNKTKGNKSILVKVKKNIIVQVDPGGHCEKGYSTCREN